MLCNAYRTIESGWHLVTLRGPAIALALTIAACAGRVGDGTDPQDEAAPPSDDRVGRGPDSSDETDAR